MENRVRPYAKGIWLFMTITLFILLPSINISFFEFSTISSKSIFFFAVTTLTLLLFAMHLINYPLQQRISIRLFDVMFALLFAFIAIRNLTQPFPFFSLRFLELLGLVSLYLMLRTISFRHGVLLSLALAIGGCIQSVYGNLQLYQLVKSEHALFSLTGSYFNPGPYSGVLAAIWVVTLWMFLFKDEILTQIEKSNDRNPRLRWLMSYIPAIGVFLITIIIPATRSRAAWLCIAVSSIILFSYKYYEWINYRLCKFTRVGKVVLVISLMCSLILSLIVMYNFKKGSSDGRLFIWTVSSKIIQNYPLCGVGFDQFKSYYMDYQGSYFKVNPNIPAAQLADNNSYAFNDLVQFIVENGVIGTLFLIGCALSLIVKARRDIFYLLGITGVVGIVSFALFSYPVQILPIKMVFVFYLSICAGKSILLKELHFDSKVRIGAAIGVIVVLTFIHAPITVRLSKGYSNWKTASYLYTAGKYNQSLPYYQAAASMLNNEGELFTHFGKALSMAGKHEESLRILKIAERVSNGIIVQLTLGDCFKEMGQYSDAEKCYKSAQYMVPSKFYPRYLLAKLYDKQGKGQEAISMANQIINQNIKVKSTAILEILTEMKKLIVKYEKSNQPPAN